MECVFTTIDHEALFKVALSLYTAEGGVDLGR